MLTRSSDHTIAASHKIDPRDADAMRPLAEPHSGLWATSAATASKTQGTLFAVSSQVTDAQMAAADRREAARKKFEAAPRDANVSSARCFS
jgi:hypothetical protein